MGGIKWLAAGVSATKGIVSVVVGVGALAGGLAAYSHTVSAFNAVFLPDITVFPTYSVSPEEIFEGKLLVFDVNFFTPKQLFVKPVGETPDNGKGIKIQDYDETTNTQEVQYYFYLENGKEVPTSKQNTAMELSSVISKWYYTVRNIALVVMMSILIYVGIRMLLCSIASEKSKYKKMLGDWVVSMFLVFLLHYIMVFAVNINESIVNLMEVATDKNQQAFVLDIRDLGARKDKFIDAIKENDKLLECLYLPNGQIATEDNADEATLFVWPVNLVGRIRMMAQMQNGSSEYVGYALAFIVLVFYTIFFTFTYLKRILYLAFLTVIAPLVAMTYSIDKISDGKAQAFNMWLKEYIFNLLIQPVHLLLYMLLISMAVDLAGQNIVYTLVAIGFMMPAEKLIRSMFGFEKAKTPGFLGGAAGAALTMTAVQNLSKLGGKGSNSKGGNKPVGKLDKSNENDPKGLYSRTANSGKGFDDIFSNENLTPTEDNPPPIPPGGGNPGDGNPGDNPPPIPPGDSDPGDNAPPIPSGDGDPGDNPPPIPPGGGNPGDGDSGDGDPGDTDYSQDDGVFDARLNDLDQEQQNADPMNFLKEDDYDDWKALADTPESNKTDIGRRDQRRLEKKAERLKKEHFDKERAKIEEERRRPQIEAQRRQEQIEAARRQQALAQEAAIREQKQKESEERLPTAKRIAAKKFREAITPQNLGNAVGSTVKGGTKLAGALLGGAVGAAAGIASGDMNKVLQNTTLGAAAGNSLGNAVGNGVVGGIESGIDRYKDSKTEYEKEKYGERYAEHLKEEQDKKFFKDREARAFYERECSSELQGLTGKAKKEKIDEIMKQAIEYRKHGVTDNNLIVKARNLDKEHRTSADSICAAVMASKAKDYKGIEPYQKRLAKKVGDEKAARIADSAANLGGFL